jgi:hypothetical protein
MSYISRMYGGTRSAPELNKNTNRVLGGLRGQGADHYSILGEDGVERNVPTQKYVQSLEQKIREQDQRLAALERKIRIESNDRKLAVQTFNRRSD